ncbi:monooxygenase [Marivirga tractuosa]|uniref:Antibiotic biosynthesis monooxygenase n=1 Tax=Marivirga tractuosa (strain ATCC 23168 / DSM 4126 / NBRC 15989 / NCIMB 1408 / VKM B-1430 / H-43) TaxID=643867 RepID=E4TU55_MARTH|nr:putative quinol monooxygenase [Marivirga tractuosa]ADR20983.1 Antibiotic biosynthesis monooxygenase [Marivirga tractuosa DSM 4126]BDD14564.1 monooxygenase [Marivirga tractuosa]
MLIRIVKMTFHKDKIDDFIKIFEENKEAIRNQAGCIHLELWQDQNQPNIFSTYSLWKNEDYLNQYRNSETFGKVWPATKALFVEKPIASSHIQRYKLE